MTRGEAHGRLAGETALVTGAARRIGREIALALGREGARVVLHCNVSVDEANETLREIEQAGGQGRVLPADLGCHGEVERILADLDRSGEEVSILINNASVFFPTPLEDLTEEQWNETLDVNLKAPFFLARDLGARMRRRGRGRIVNLADWAGYRPYENYVPYCISKAGLIASTQGLARELAPAVQVNAVAPGPVLPPEDISDHALQGVIAATPLGRVGTPGDVVAAVLFFLTGSDFVTGAILPVDGGRLIG